MEVRERENGEEKGKLGILLDRTLRIQLSVSIVASILVIYFIQPLLEYTWAVLVIILSKSFQTLLDGVYRSAALGHNRDETSFFVLMLGIGLGIPFFFIFAHEMGRLQGRLSYLLSRLRGEEKLPVDRKDRLRERLLDLAGWLGMAVVLVAFLYILTVQFADLQLNSSFQQRMTVLAPHITGQEEKELRAVWASMRSRNDYLLLNEHLERLAAEKAVKLPSPLLK